MSKAKSKNKKESFWEVFGAFVFEASTYTEIMDRVKFFNENQSILKKIPSSATPENACLVRFLNRLFRATPREIPKTRFNYLKSLIKETISFESWMQDNFQIFHLDEIVNTIFALYIKDRIPQRLNELAPENSDIEVLCNLAIDLYGVRNEMYLDSINKIDVWRQNNKEDFKTLSGLLVSGLPNKSLDTLSTEECIKSAYQRKNHTPYDFVWEGKDISYLRSELTDIPKLYLDAESSVGKHGCKYETIDGEKQLISKDNNLDSENLYIEGDNLRVLKALTPEYTGKIKMIYIDPPYNTGHEFVYKDKFSSEMEIFENFLFKPIKKAKPEV